jgi:hypothetical protein
MRLVTLHNIRTDTAPLAINKCTLSKYAVGNFAWNAVIPLIFWIIAYISAPVVYIILMLVESAICTYKDVRVPSPVFHIRVRERMVPFWRGALYTHAMLRRCLPDSPVCLEKYLFIYPFYLNMMRFYKQACNLSRMIGMNTQITMLDIIFVLKIFPFILFFLSYFPKYWCPKNLLYIPLIYHAACTLGFATWDYYWGILRMGRIYVMLLGYFCILIRFFYPYRKTISSRVHWYSPHLLSDILFECDCDYPTFQLRGATALKRAIAPLQLPQTLALQVSAGTRAMLEYVFLDLEGFHLRGVAVGHTSA